MNFAKVYEDLEEAIKNDYGYEAIYDPTFDHRFYLWDDMFSYDEDNRPTPHFSVKEAANFFARSAWWLRWKYRPECEPGFILNGVQLEPKRTPSGSRYYTLADIERMAHALAESRSIGGEALAQIMVLVLTQAAMYGVFHPKRSD